MQVTNIPVDKHNRESTQHGSRAFPMAVYYSVMSRNIMGYTRLHWHEELQFCLVVQGRIDFHVKEKLYHLETGDGIFINSGCLHMARPVGDPGSTYICLDVSPQLLGAFPGSGIEQRYLLPALRDATLVSQVLHRTVPWELAILSSIRNIYEWDQKKAYGYELEILIHLQTMFLTLLRHHPQVTMPHKRSRSNAAVQQIISYINQHYQEKITLKDIAAHASYAESECCRVFKKFTGESIFAYIRSYRLEQSTYMLKDSDYSISDIAYACGFSSTSHYIEAFRGQFGRTPLKYRQMGK